MASGFHQQARPADRRNSLHDRRLRRTDGSPVDHQAACPTGLQE
jgi:hypothetical protein